MNSQSDTLSNFTEKMSESAVSRVHHHQPWIPSGSIPVDPEYAQPHAYHQQQQLYQQPASYDYGGAQMIGMQSLGDAPANPEAVLARSHVSASTNALLQEARGEKKDDFMAGFDLDNEESAEAVDFDDGILELKVDGAFGSIFDNGEQPDMSKPHYSVEHYYKEKGMAQKLARSDRFINVTLCVIVANAVYLGIDQDWNKADDITQTHPFFVACDNLFCGYFTVELMVRFYCF